MIAKFAAVGVLVLTVLLAASYLGIGASRAGNGMSDLILAADNYAQAHALTLAEVTAQHMTPLTRLPSNLALPIVASGALIEIMPPPDLPQPPNDPCKLITELTGKPCQWKVFRTKTANGGEFYDLQLRSGDVVLGRNQIMQVGIKDLQELPQILKMYPGQQSAWVGVTEVPEWVSGSGFGKLMWQAGDILIHTFNNPSNALRIFVDGAGWGPKLLQGIENVAQIDASIWTYIIH